MADQESIEQLLAELEEAYVKGGTYLEYADGLRQAVFRLRDEIRRLQKLPEYWRQRWAFQMELGDKQASEVLEQHQEIERLRDEIKNLYASNNRIGGKLRKCREENERLRAVVQEESDHHKRLAADVALGGDAIYMTGPNIAEYHKERADLLERALKGDTDG